jgi:hypothetical protein
VRGFATADSHAFVTDTKNVSYAVPWQSPPLANYKDNTCTPLMPMPSVLLCKGEVGVQDKGTLQYRQCIAQYNPHSLSLAAV